jgi:hypothetical protein
MYEELKAWADKWNIAYTEENYNGELCIKFDGKIFTNATYGEGKVSFEYNSKSGRFKWSGDMC